MIAPALSTDLIDINEVQRSTGMKRTFIYDKIKKGEFPKQKQLGTRTVRWVRGEVEAWKAQYLET
ncbi:helix-turn-helix transcriptional regulator [Sodalis sp. RH16]|uniref:helix-turn-helix transcriptional regulator n=1 Tax=Sodalis sp. RH16 TaxID=3394331 RepID=UPI0039B41F75